MLILCAQNSVIATVVATVTADGPHPASLIRPYNGNTSEDAAEDQG
ncbi:MAG: hypothetical protein ACNYPE_02150 [Candidatus Azotimanducaceae bacterium WSBS_2022_MAG_OTU7]